jgi:hypothetical protein
MQRIVRGRSATITHTFDVDGTPTDPSPDTTTVTISRGDGTVLYADVATTDTGTGTCSFTLTPTDTSLLDTLIVTWKATFGGYPQTFIDLVEIAGDVLFTVAKARSELGDPAYDAQKIADARTAAEGEIERGLNYALVPRYKTTTLDIRYGPLRVAGDVTSLRSITIAGTPLTPEELATVSFADGFLDFYRWPTGYSSSRFDMVVAYERGVASPPPGASENVLALALSKLEPASASGIDPRAESIVTVDGTVRLRANDGQFSALGVNEWVRANRRMAIA